MRAISGAGEKRWVMEWVSMGLVGGAAPSLDLLGNALRVRGGQKRGVWGDRGKSRANGRAGWKQLGQFRWGLEHVGREGGSD
jgi:hypothetical protein